MQRPIEFRACIKDTKTFIFTGATEFRFGSYLKTDGDKVFIGWRNEDGWFEDEVDPETVGEYTGLTDKNGVEIFEDDIVKEIYTDHEEVGVVEYSLDRFGVRLPHIEGRLDSALPQTYCYIEVIGNRFNNPELIKGNQLNAR
jgi:uncharacterized phage protein (TIGR01671 family)